MLLLWHLLPMHAHAHPAATSASPAASICVTKHETQGEYFQCKTQIQEEDFQNSTLDSERGF